VSTRRLSLVLLALVACGCGSRVDDRNDLKVDAAPSDSDRDLSACPAGATSCAAQCVDTNHDPDHCGTCDRGCGEAEVCHDGACSIACPPELTACAPIFAMTRPTAGPATTHAQRGRSAARGPAA